MLSNKSYTYYRRLIGVLVEITNVLLPCVFMLSNCILLKMSKKYPWHSK
uniref:Uncharacterized protein n=1 Tax=Rhizophora mucronata TaxID=61149 RepID=A0A2P2NLN4_RHIMU